MIRNNKGFILLECMMSMIILSIVVLTLIQTLPPLIKRSKTIETEQAIKTQLYRLADQLLNQQIQPFEILTFDSPIFYQVSDDGHKICATYQLEATHEKSYCLQK